MSDRHKIDANHRAVLRFCTSCTGENTDEMRQHLESILDDAKLSDALKVSSVECMGACDTPLALALQGTQRATYLFAGIDVKSDKDDIVATCRTYLDSPAGWIEDARPCGRLRLCLRARIPANDAD